MNIIISPWIIDSCRAQRHTVVVNEYDKRILITLPLAIIIIYIFRAVSQLPFIDYCNNTVVTRQRARKTFEFLRCRLRSINTIINPRSFVIRLLILLWHRTKLTLVWLKPSFYTTGTFANYNPFVVVSVDTKHRVTIIKNISFKSYIARCDGGRRLTFSQFSFRLDSRLQIIRFRTLGSWDK